MIKYIPLINDLWPIVAPSEDSTNGSAAEVNNLKRRAEQLSAKVEADLASISGSSSDDKLASKANELYVNVVQNLGGVEAIEQYRAFI